MELVLDVDERLYERLSERAERHGFESTEAYSTIVLETVLAELEGSERTGEVEQRLEDLGYL